MSGPGLHPFNYGNAIGQAQNILNARTKNQLAQRELDPNSLRNQLLNQQLVNAQNAGQPDPYTLSPGSGRYSGEGDLVSERPFAPPKETQQTKLYRNLVEAGLKPGTKEFQAKMLEIMGKSGVTVNTGDFKQTKGRTKLDQTFATEYSKLVASGGFADITKQIGQLKGVSAKLSKSDTLTGPVVGGIPDWLQTFINPAAVAAREDVEEVVQRNLRLILGAQFTEKEGERLIARAYNPRLQERENKIRVDRLIKQMTEAAEAKIAAARYFGEHGTLTGFTGKLWTIDDFTFDSETPTTADVEDDLSKYSIEELMKMKEGL